VHKKAHQIGKIIKLSRNLLKIEEKEFLEGKEFFQIVKI